MFLPRLASCLDRFLLLSQNLCFPFFSVVLKSLFYVKLNVKVSLIFIILVLCYTTVSPLKSLVQQKLFMYEKIVSMGCLLDEFLVRTVTLVMTVKSVSMYPSGIISNIAC